MKQCPYCTTNNRDEAAVCFYCGYDLRSVPVSSPDAGPTQPIRTRPMTFPTQPPLTEVSPYQGYSPAARPLPVPDRSNRLSQVTVMALVVLFVAACGLAAWTIFSVPGSGITGLIPRPAASATPTPTLTPEPTATVEPGAAGGDPAQDFVMEKLLSPECANALNTLSSVSSQTSEQPLKLLDSTWRDTLNQSVSEMKTYCGTLESASPVPGRVAEVRQNITQANSEFDEANRLWKEGIDERNPGKILEAGQHIQQATQYLNQAINDLEHLVQ